MTRGKNKRARDKGNEIRMNVWLKRDESETGRTKGEWVVRSNVIICGNI